MESTVHIQICYASTFNFNLTSPLWIPPSVGRKKNGPKNAKRCLLYKDCKTRLGEHIPNWLLLRLVQ